MLHLIPQHQKKIVLGEYHKRLYIVIAVAITIVVAAGIIFLLPSYILANNRHQDIQTRDDTLELQIATGQKSINADAVKEIANSVDVLQPLGSTIEPSDAFNALLPHAANNGIQITYIDYLPNSDGSVTLDITGVAPTRDTLASFIDELKAEPYFSGVSLPLSNFIKETDIDFSLKINMLAGATSTPATQ